VRATEARAADSVPVRAALLVLARAAERAPRRGRSEGCGEPGVERIHALMLAAPPVGVRAEIVERSVQVARDVPNDDRRDTPLLLQIVRLRRAEREVEIFRHLMGAGDAGAHVEIEAAKRDLRLHIAAVERAHLVAGLIVDAVGLTQEVIDA